MTYLKAAALALGAFVILRLIFYAFGAESLGITSSDLHFAIGVAGALAAHAIMSPIEL